MSISLEARSDNGYVVMYVYMAMGICVDVNFIWNILYVNILGEYMYVYI